MASIVYSLQEYGAMICNSVRTDAYAQALRQVVRPGSVVLDLGTGAGIFALLACQYGARRVYAIDPAGAINVAREIAQANQLEQRITFMQDVSTQVELPEKVDVIVCDIRGTLPLNPSLASSIADARRRFLAPGGVLIPQRDHLWAAVVEAPKVYERDYSQPWDSNPYGLDMSAGRLKVINTWQNTRFEPHELLTEPKCWGTLDYTRVEDATVHATVTWTVTRAGTAHGLVLWFDSTLAEGVSFSNAPGQPELVYGTAFYPWAQPVTVAEGDRVAVTLQAKLVGGSYFWKWETIVLDRDHPEPPKVHFEQSSFFAAPISPEQLRRCAGSHVPTLNPDGQVDRFILDQMTGTTALETIAYRLVEGFPGRFADVQQALTRVGTLSVRYGNR